MLGRPRWPLRPRSHCHRASRSKRRRCGRPRLPPPAAAEPAWLRYAVPAPPTGNRPLVAIVLDDLGLDRARTAAAIRLRGPLTMSFMTYASDLGEQTAAAPRAGDELLLHVPMEAVDRHADPGPHGLFTAMPREEIIERLRWGLGRFDGFVGINNHMGSKFTADAQSMAPVIEELRARGLVFLEFADLAGERRDSPGGRLRDPSCGARRLPRRRPVALGDRQATRPGRAGRAAARQRYRHRSPARFDDRRPQGLAAAARRERARPRPGQRRGAPPDGEGGGGGALMLIMGL